MADHKVLIMAKTTEEFEKIEKKLSLFPQLVYEQIANAGYHFGALVLTLNERYEKALHLPNIVQQQAVLDGIVHIYLYDKARSLECRIVLTEKMSEKPIPYVFVEMPEIKMEL